MTTTNVFNYSAIKRLHVTVTQSWYVHNVDHTSRM